MIPQLLMSRNHGPGSCVQMADSYKDGCCPQSWYVRRATRYGCRYPSFLIIRQYGEFLTMSVLGHVSYGLVIGAWARYRLRDESHLDSAPNQG